MLARSQARAAGQGREFSDLGQGQAGTNSRPTKETCLASPISQNWAMSNIHLNRQNLIGVGTFAHVHRLDERRVRKVPAPDPDNLDLAINSIQREVEIYDHLGDHPRFIKCLTKGDLFIDLEYAQYGPIDSYLKSHSGTSDNRRMQFAREIIEAVVLVHSKGIIHSDLAARQFLLNKALHVHLSDFGFSSFSNGDVLGFEHSSHYL